MKAFLNQSCDMGPNHKSCLTLWNNATQQLASNTSTAAVSYSVRFIIIIIITMNNTLP